MCVQGWDSCIAETVMFDIIWSTNYNLYIFIHIVWKLCLQFLSDSRFFLNQAAYVLKKKKKILLLLLYFLFNNDITYFH